MWIVQPDFALICARIDSGNHAFTTTFLYMGHFKRAQRFGDLTTLPTFQKASDTITISLKQDRTSYLGY